jgi:hypothetical protein
MTVHMSEVELEPDTHSEFVTLGKLRSGSTLSGQIPLELQVLQLPFKVKIKPQPSDRKDDS